MTTVAAPGRDAWQLLRGADRAKDQSYVLAVRVAERNAPRPGDSVHFAVDPDHVLIFPARRQAV